VKPLRFFADHCVSNAIMHTLRAIGAEVLRLREHLPTDAPDEVVITTAQQLEAILVLAAGITQRVPLAVMSRTWRAFWFSCMSTEWVSDAD